jgi:pyridoxal phosphate enzyme (YggS family)
MNQQIRDNVRRLLAEIPPEVEIMAAVKTRTAGEIAAAVDAGISTIGENYIQEAEAAVKALGERARWHFIGHLQLNKVKKAVEIFNVIETVDSLALAQAINRHAIVAGKTMPVLIEVNIGREPQKNGVLPELVVDLARSISQLPNVKLAGLMTMGPLLPAESLRPFFAETQRIFESLRLECLPGTDIRYLSMGMSDSYRVAIEEGANLIRLGTALFGSRC